MSLPAGIVTFLFTDIEGSTRLWEARPEAMRQALARHDALAAAVVAPFGGQVVKSRGEGDSLFIVFPQAAGALAAACALQQAFLREDLPEGLPLRVRMALHTGEADLRDADYFGLPVNRCARLRAIAHGGQILLSQATAEQAENRLPEGARLKDLGTHRLRDLTRPEQVHQLLHPGLPADFPPLRSLNALKHNLPVQLTSFIGRERELAEVGRLLATSRLLTLTGSGGVGKSRLALQVAADLLDDYPEGVWLVELASLTAPALVPQAVAAALGLGEEPGAGLSELLAARLRIGKRLLLLDNCEHLLDACSRLAVSLLQACPHLKIMATSREGLGLTGEVTYRVPSLGLPDTDPPPPPDTLARYESVRLFSERARAHHPAFSVSDRNAPALAQVCSRLDGIPLALELAAARVRVMPVEQIAARLDDRFRLLTGGSRTALPRQQTLRALIDWSYDLLNESERLLLHRLAVFAGGWTLEAAEMVCAEDEATGETTEDLPGITRFDVLDLLASLVDKSLVVYEEREGEARYRLLETVRQYAEERLAASGEQARVQVRHGRYFLQVGEEAARAMHGPEQTRWLNRLEAENDNLRAALDRAQERPDLLESGLRLAGALQRFWEVRGHFSEGRACCETLLEKSAALPASPEQADVLNAAGVMAHSQGDYAAARAFHERALAMRRLLGDERAVAGSLGNLANLARNEGDYARARTLYEEALALARALHITTWEGHTLLNLGIMAGQQGDHAGARRCFEEARRLYAAQDNRGMLLYVYNCLAVAADEMRETAAALAHYHEALRLCRELGDRLNTAYALEGLAALLARQEQAGRAARLYGATEALREQIGAPVRPVNLEAYEKTRAAVRASLGAETYERLREAGRALSWEQAIALALEPRVAGGLPRAPEGDA